MTAGSELSESLEWCSGGVPRSGGRIHDAASEPSIARFGCQMLVVLNGLER
jgi:hypothetical protein